MEEDKNTLDLHPEVMAEDRVARAVALFREGYNCSQSVVTAFADLYGFTREQALHMSASFGGGIGRMRETCGAACGMFLLAGLWLTTLASPVYCEYRYMYGFVVCVPLFMGLALGTKNLNIKTET